MNEFSRVHPHTKFPEDEMESIGVSGIMSENGGCSSVIMLPNYKRSRVSAVRDFPPGCGPNASKAEISSNGGEYYRDNAQNAELSAGDCLEFKSKTTFSASDCPALIQGFDKSLHAVLNAGELDSLKEEHTVSAFPEDENKKTLSSAESPRVVLEAGELELLKVHTDAVSAVAFAGVEKIKTLASLHGGLKLAEQEMLNEERSLDELPESENKRTSFAAESPHSSNLVDKSVHVVLKAIEHELMMDEHSFGGSVELSKSLGTTDMSGELLPISCHSSQTLQVNAEYITKHLLPEKQEQSKDLIEEYNQEAIAGVLNKDGKISVQEEKMLAIDKLPPLNLISPADVCKERNYPPRRRVSAIRDFPRGCGTNPSYSSEGQYTLAELQSNMSVEREKLKLAYDRKMEKETSEVSYTKKAMTYRNGKEDKNINNMYHGKDTSLQTKEMVFSDHAKHTGIQQGPKVAANFPRQQGIATSSHMGAKNSRQEKGFVGKQVKFRVKPYHYEAKKDNEERKTVVRTGKLLRWDANSFKNNSRQKHVLIRAESREVDVRLPPIGASSLFDAVARNKVRETLRFFQALTRKVLQVEETNPKEQKSIRRVDLHALKIFKDKGLYSNAEKPIIGDVPGVEVGDEFHYRVELMIIGLHRHSQGGIDCMKEGDTTLATSVVDSGGYDNRVDDYDLWTYTGQGGNMNARDKAPEDQKLERGNLALKNSIKAKNLVRVIRGVKNTKCFEGKSKVSTTYTYYGLYTVERCWQEIGQHGIKEYKFELKRVPGQRELPSIEVKRSKKLKLREGLCVSDISEGKEQLPICAVNTIDGEKPPPFKYISCMKYPAYKPLHTRGCDCIKGCMNSTDCSCVVKNGGDIPYNFDGAIVEAKPIVYECGPSCKCPPSCYNRVSQHGIIFQLEIFKTESRGWGVRSLSSIPSGSFICEYTGELLEDKEAEKRIDDDEYLFDIGQNRNDHSIWDGLSGLISNAALRSHEVVADSGFTIDAAKYGNVGRFINHSCSPNLYAQNVLYDHGDKRMPHIMLFAAENIPPLQELTYHYNYKLGQVYDKDGNVKVKYCYCGSPNCTGRLKDESEKRNFSSKFKRGLFILVHFLSFQTQLIVMPTLACLLLPQKPSAIPIMLSFVGLTVLKIQCRRSKQKRCNDILFLVLMFQHSLVEVVQVIPLVCKSWGKYLEEPDCWRKIDVDGWCCPYEDVDDRYDYMLRMLIKKSSGFLRELSVSFVSDEQMLFIGELAGPSLHTLSANYAYIGDSIAEEVATKLSGLTTLDLSCCKEISPRGMESIGRNCQELVSLTCGLSLGGSDFIDPPHEDIARAIAHTMPKLKHLHITDFDINTSVALEILSCCPELETLDCSQYQCAKLDQSLLEEKYPNVKVLVEEFDDDYDDFISDYGEVVQVIPLVCKSWGKYLEEPDCWRKIDVDGWCCPYEDVDDRYDYILRMLIKKSSGFLRELSVSFVSDEQMLFIGELAGPSLHTLSANYAYIGDSIAEEVATKLSGLTTLDLSCCKEISPRGMESIGRNCQELVSLTCGLSLGGSDFIDPPHEDIARAIAHTMPKLKHLHITDFDINTSVALEILSCCPELETLDCSQYQCAKLDQSLLEEKYPNVKVLVEEFDDDYDDFISDYDHPLGHQDEDLWKQQQPRRVYILSIEIFHILFVICAGSELTQLIVNIVLCHVISAQIHIPVFHQKPPK
ncbi:hypothetical protein V2J09_000185 [Rumex salicifolius]